MGTHSRGPSKIASPQELSGQMLLDWLKSNRWALGDSVSVEYNGELPFMFKVLSINKALSIQAHPTKEHAQFLHKNFPEHYRDPNHKPELAVAISEFEGFCGFRPFVEIQRFVSDVPELRELVGTKVCDLVCGAAVSEDQKPVLKELFTVLMESQEEQVRTTLTKLVERLKLGNNRKMDLISHT